MQKFTNHLKWFYDLLPMPLNKPIPDFFIRLWRKVRRYELSRTLRATEKRIAYVKKSIAYIDQVEGREHK